MTTTGQPGLGLDRGCPAVGLVQSRAPCCLRGPVRAEPPTALGLVVADLFSRVWHQTEMPSPLDGNGQSPLVPGTSAGFAPVFNFATLGHEAAQGSQVLIVDRLCLFQAKGAYLLSSLKASSVAPAWPTTLTPAAGRTGWSVGPARSVSAGLYLFAHYFSCSP
jgi:hypothetical protein